MKKLFRGHVLSWLDGTIEAGIEGDPPIPVRAARALERVASGELAIAEPLVGEALRSIAARGKGEPRVDRAAIREVEAELKRPRVPQSVEWPFELEARYRIVLPQRHRVSFDRAVLRPDGTALHVLLRDFRSIPRAEGERYERFEPLWRVFHMRSPRRPMREVLAFTQHDVGNHDADSSPVGIVPVHLCSAPDAPVLTIDTRLYTLRESWQLEELSRLDVPLVEDGANRLRSIAIHGETTWAVWEAWEDECRLLRFSSRGECEADLGYVGSRAGRLVCDRLGRPLVSDLYELQRYEINGELSASRNLRPFFAEYKYDGDELVVPTPEGGVLVANQQKVVLLSESFEDVVEEYIAPHRMDALTIDETYLAALAVDSVAATATIHVYRR